MVGVPEWEFQYRWDQIGSVGIYNAIEMLEARDQALEQHLRDGFGSCFATFNYTFRWYDILRAPLADQITMLEARDQDLERIVTFTGGGNLDIPFRWVQLWEGMSEGGTWAFACAEENDRYLERALMHFSCGALITVSDSFALGGGVSSPHNVVVAGNIANWVIQAVDCFEGAIWNLRIDNGDAHAVWRLNLPSGGTVDAVVDLETFALTGTFPGDAFVTVSSADSFAPTFSQIGYEATGVADGNPITLNTFFMSVEFTEGETLTWFNPS